MADSPSPILLLRFMSTGAQVNLWGTYTNTSLQTAERAVRGYQAYTATGDATISWANYSASNDFAAMQTKIGGSPAAAYALTLPGYQTFQSVWNNSGQTSTLKNSGGTGVAIPAGRRSLVFGDGTGIYDAAPNWLSSYPTLTNAGDIVVKATMDAAISALATAQNGLVLTSSSATQSKYLDGALTVAGDLAITKTSAGTASEALLITHTPYWNAPRYVAAADSPVTALNRDVIYVNTTGDVEIDFPASGRVWVIDQTGNANAKPITLDPAGSDTTTIDTIDLPYFSGVFTRNASGNWDIS